MHSDETHLGPPLVRCENRNATPESAQGTPTGKTPRPLAVADDAQPRPRQPEGEDKAHARRAAKIQRPAPCVELWRNNGPSWKQQVASTCAEEWEADSAEL